MDDDIKYNCLSIFNLQYCIDNIENVVMLVSGIPLQIEHIHLKKSTSLYIKN
jgi:hypothetical protein